MISTSTIHFRMKCPEVHALAESMGCVWPLVATKWFICLFVDVLPTEAGGCGVHSLVGVCRVWLWYCKGKRLMISTPTSTQTSTPTDCFEAVGLHVLGGGQDPFPGVCHSHQAQCPSHLAG